MVTGFHRSFSLPGSPRPKSTRPNNHIRSVSFPCGSHLLISRLDHHIQSLTSWLSSRPESEPALATWIRSGLTSLEHLHSSLHPLLLLRPGSPFSDRVLDDFLRFADAYGSFRSETLALIHHLSDAQLALRRRDAAALSSALRSVKCTEKRISRIAASSLREISATRSAKASELAGRVREVIDLTVAASTAVFVGTAAAADSSTSTAKRSRFWLKKRGGDEEKKSAEEQLRRKRLEALEELVKDIETQSERVLKCLINNRVTLLTTIT